MSGGNLTLSIGALPRRGLVVLELTIDDESPKAIEIPAEEAEQLATTVLAAARLESLPAAEQLATTILAAARLSRTTTTICGAASIDRLLELLRDACVAR